MATIVLRSVKGSALTFEEGDANFSNLNDDKLEDITGESIGDLSDVDITSTTDGYVLTYNSGSGNIELQPLPAGGGMTELLDDLTPQLGGDLDGQAFSVTDIELANYKETIYSLGTTDAPTIDVANGNVQSVNISAGLDLPNFSNAETGQSVTLIVSGSGTLTGTVNYLFAGGNTTLTTSSIVSVFYDGSTYWTNVATDFQ